MTPWLSHHAPLVNKLLSAAQAAVAAVTDVRLDVSVDRGIVRVVTSTPTTTAEKARIRAAIEAVGRVDCPSAVHWRCDTQTEKPRPYVSHVVDWKAAAHRHPRKMLRVEDVCVFPLTLLEIDALARAHELLEKVATDSRLVATFALGGLPLLHWLASPKQETIAKIDAALKAADRFHLLPGLNWSGSKVEKDTFQQWLAKAVQQDAGHILIFDTGRDGNGVREAEGLAVEVLRSASPHEGVSVTVLGILDGRRRCGHRTVVRGANGVRVPLRLRYEFVRHLPTEDCELLIGYQVDRKRTALHTVDGLVLLRVGHSPWPIRWIDAASRLFGIRSRLPQYLSQWDRYTFLGSTRGAKSLHDLVVSHDARRSLVDGLGAEHREDREWSTAGILLSNAEDAELARLDNAITWGLIPPANLSGIEQGIRGRFAAARDRILRAQWNRELKKVEVLHPPE